jgi:hypothetical protein
MWRARARANGPFLTLHALAESFDARFSDSTPGSLYVSEQIAGPFCCIIICSLKRYGFIGVCLVCRFRLKTVGWGSTRAES